MTRVSPRPPCLPSVTIPNVPSAPTNNLVVSNPALDFLHSQKHEPSCLSNILFSPKTHRARFRVLMTSPLGRTTVIFRNHSALAVPYRTALVPLPRRLASGNQPQDRTCLHPVLIMPPIVAPNKTRGSAHICQQRDRTHPVLDRAVERARYRATLVRH